MKIINPLGLLGIKDLTLRNKIRMVLKKPCTRDIMAARLRTTSEAALRPLVDYLMTVSCVRLPEPVDFIVDRFDRADDYTLGKYWNGLDGALIGGVCNNVSDYSVDNINYGTASVTAAMRVSAAGNPNMVFFNFWPESEFTEADFYKPDDDGLSGWVRKRDTANLMTSMAKSLSRGAQRYYHPLKHEDKRGYHVKMILNLPDVTEFSGVSFSATHNLALSMRYGEVDVDISGVEPLQIRAQPTTLYTGNTLPIDYPDIYFRNWPYRGTFVNITNMDYRNTMGNGEQVTDSGTINFFYNSETAGFDLISANLIPAGWVEKLLAVEMPTINERLRYAYLSHSSYNFNLSPTTGSSTQPALKSQELMEPYTSSHNGTIARLKEFTEEQYNDEEYVAEALSNMAPFAVQPKIYMRAALFSSPSTPRSVTDEQVTDSSGFDIAFDSVVGEPLVESHPLVEGLIRIGNDADSGTDGQVVSYKLGAYGLKSSVTYKITYPDRAYTVDEYSNYANNYLTLTNTGYEGNTKGLQPIRAELYLQQFVNVIELDYVRVSGRYNVTIKINGYTVGTQTQLLAAIDKEKKDRDLAWWKNNSVGFNLSEIVSPAAHLNSNDYGLIMFKVWVDGMPEPPDEESGHGLYFHKDSEGNDDNYLEYTDGYHAGEEYDPLKYDNQERYYYNLEENEKYKVLPDGELELVGKILD